MSISSMSIDNGALFARVGYHSFGLLAGLPSLEV